MSNIPRVGTRSLILLAVTTVLSIGLQIAARGKMAGHPAPQPPIKADQFEGQKISSPIDEGERDYARTTYRLYTKADVAPIYVSITRAETLNAFRAPYQYLLDADGRMRENQKGVLPRDGEDLPVHLYERIAGRGTEAIVLHWAQNWGGEPIVEPLTMVQMFDATIRHEPVYIVDVWSKFRAEGGSPVDIKTIIHLADYVDRMINNKRLK